MDGFFYLNHPSTTEPTIHPTKNTDTTMGRIHSSSHTMLYDVTMEYCRGISNSQSMPLVPEHRMLNGSSCSNVPVLLHSVVFKHFASGISEMKGLEMIFQNIQKWPTEVLVYFSNLVVELVKKKRCPEVSQLNFLFIFKWKFLR